MEETEAEKRQFILGHIIALSHVYRSTGSDTLCYEVMHAAGITYEETLTFDLCEYDAKHMVGIFWYKGGLGESLGKGELTLSEYLATLETE